MMKRKSIQEALDRGESLPVPIDKSKQNANKRNTEYRVNLIGLLINITCINHFIILTGHDAFYLEETNSGCHHSKWRIRKRTV